MYAFLTASTGWTWDYIQENVDVPRLKALLAYWKKNPPLHILAKQYLGFDDSEKGKIITEETKKNTDYSVLVASFPSRKHERLANNDFLGRKNVRES